MLLTRSHCPSPGSARWTVPAASSTSSRTRHVSRHRRPALCTATLSGRPSLFVANLLSLSTSSYPATNSTQGPHGSARTTVAASGILTDFFLGIHVDGVCTGTTSFQMTTISSINSFTHYNNLYVILIPISDVIGCDTCTRSTAATSMNQSAASVVSNNTATHGHQPSHDRESPRIANPSRPCGGVR